jgi:hypothetical protein
MSCTYLISLSRQALIASKLSRKVNAFNANTGVLFRIAKLAHEIKKKKETAIL